MHDEDDGLLVYKTSSEGQNHESQQVNGQRVQMCRSSIEDCAKRIHSLLRGSFDVLCTFEDILIVFDQVKTLKE